LSSAFSQGQAFDPHDSYRSRKSQPRKSRYESQNVEQNKDEASVSHNNTEDGFVVVATAVENLDYPDPDIVDAEAVTY